LINACFSYIYRLQDKIHYNMNVYLTEWSLVYGWAVMVVNVW